MDNVASWGPFSFSPHFTTCMIEMRKFQGELLGPLQVCVGFKVLSSSYRWSAVSCVSGVENNYFVISQPSWQILERNASILLFPALKKKVWLMPSPNISGLFVFIFYHCNSHTRFWTKYWDLSIRFFFGVLSEEHARSSFKSMHYFYLNYFIAASHKEYSIIMACRSSKT